MQISLLMAVKKLATSTLLPSAERFNSVPDANYKVPCFIELMYRDTSQHEFPTSTS